MIPSGPRGLAPARLQVVELRCVRDDRELFDGLNFEVQSGQILVVEGPNGCGKTTLLRALCGMRLQESGTVLWCAENIEELGALYHAQMAYVGHHDGVKRELTVLENVRLAQALGKPSERSIEDILARIELSGTDDVLAQALSAGQRRRLALARLLATDSRLWILDEPFTSLDRHGIALFADLLVEHAANDGLVVMTSHHSVDLESVNVRHLRLS